MCKEGGGDEKGVDCYGLCAFLLGRRFSNLFDRSLRRAVEGGDNLVWPIVRGAGVVQWLRLLMNDLGAVHGSLEACQNYWY